mmetsp:Transcript_18163/g.46108  ORF Transcript_18163/g.46108 Transcript_18163/m.46108 type:complete len:327 (-) Transcript_18163:534-1514(-)
MPANPGVAAAPSAQAQQAHSKLPVYLVENVDFPPTRPPIFEHQKEDVKFDPKVHLQIEPPTTLVDLNYNEVPFPLEKPGQLAYSKPFRVLSEEGVKVMKEVVLRNQECYGHSDERISMKIRGLAYLSDFIVDFNRSKEVDAVASLCSGEELCAHPMPMNYSHTNIGAVGVANQVDQWHIDSVDYVLVVILSDLTGAEGGELEVINKPKDEAFKLLEVGDEEDLRKCILSVNYLSAGYGIFMQGSKMVHHVNAVRRALEPRISMVMSYTRRDCFSPAHYTRMNCFVRTDGREISNPEFARARAWRCAIPPPSPRRKAQRARTRHPAS